MAQTVGRGIAILFHDRGTRKGVSGQQHAPAALYPRVRPGTHFTGAEWAPGSVWTDGKSRLHWDFFLITTLLILQQTNTVVAWKISH